MSYFTAIFARDVLGGMGHKGGLPWDSRDDLAWFKSHTVGSVVIMGRKTFESLGKKALPGRHNIVVSSANPALHELSVPEISFAQIRAGKQTIECLLRDMNHSKIKANHLCVIRPIDGKESAVVRQIKSTREYPSFDAALAALADEPASQIAPGSSVHELTASYRKLYSFQSERAHGVVAIEMTANNNNNNVYQVCSLDDALKLAQHLKTIPATKPPVAPVVDAKDAKDVKDVKSDGKSDGGKAAVKRAAGGVFVIGGAGLLLQAFGHPKMERVIESLYVDPECRQYVRINEIRYTYPCPSIYVGSNHLSMDVSFSKPIPDDFVRVVVEHRPQSACTKFVQGRIVLDVVRSIYVRRQKDNAESAYLELMRKVISQGVSEVDRTGVGTVSTFGEMFKCDLAKGFPLLTSKQVFWKGVVAELLWFLRGETNVAALHADGVHFWDGNLNSPHTQALKLPKGELGPVYGKQWRAFGSGAPGSVTVDQIRRAIDDIRSSPNSRRIIVSAWNPMVIDQVALPSCHCFFQFEVKQGKLSLFLLMRSNDLFLGAPLNLASYALLVHIIAGMTGLQVGSLVYTVSNCHVYLNHVQQANEQLQRPTRPFPTILIDQKILDSIYPPPPATTTVTASTFGVPGATAIAAATVATAGPDFGRLRREHIRLIGYDPHPTISAPLAV